MREVANYVKWRLMATLTGVNGRATGWGLWGAEVGSSDTHAHSSCMFSHARNSENQQ